MEFNAETTQRPQTSELAAKLAATSCDWSAFRPVASQVHRRSATIAASLQDRNNMRGLTGVKQAGASLPGVSLSSHRVGQ